MPILIVDDCDISLTMLERALDDLTPKILKAHSGKDAINLLSDAEILPILAILDVKMPNMNGFELLEAIRSNPRFVHIPIIFISAEYIEHSDVLKGYDNGGVDYLIKPFDHQVLRSKVQSFIRLELAYKEHERLERELNELKRISSLWQLTHGVSNNFSNLLSVICGYSELARRQLSEESLSIQKLEECLNQIELAGNQGSNLIKQMLSYVKEDVSDEIDAPQPIQSDKIVSRTLQLLKDVLPRSIKLVTNISSNLPTVFVLPIKLNQILTNLIVNSIDAIGDIPGVMTVSLKDSVVQNKKCSCCREKFDGHYVVLSVNDTGIGIPPDVIQSIFEPFFSTKHQGFIGLGLSVVDGMTHKTGGHVCVESQIGIGSTFEIFFPAKDSKNYMR